MPGPARGRTLDELSAITRTSAAFLAVVLADEERRAHVELGADGRYRVTDFFMRRHGDAFRYVNPSGR